MEDKVCHFYNSGYCKFQKDCKFFHAEERCEGECSGKNCRKRHPKLCKFGEKCRRKTFCEYRHNDVLKESNLKGQVEALQILVEELVTENKETKAKVFNLEKELTLVKKRVDQKKPSVPVKEVVKKNENATKKKQVKEDEKKEHDRQTVDDKKVTKCDECGKEFSQEGYMEDHIKVRHPKVVQAKTKQNLSKEAPEILKVNKTKIVKVISTVRCEFCEKSFAKTDREELKAHCIAAHNITDYESWIKASREKKFTP